MIPSLTPTKETSCGEKKGKVLVGFSSVHTARGPRKWKNTTQTGNDERQCNVDAVDLLRPVRAIPSMTCSGLNSSWFFWLVFTSSLQRASKPTRHILARTFSFAVIQRTQWHGLCCALKCWWKKANKWLMRRQKYRKKNKKQNFFGPVWRKGRWW